MSAARDPIASLFPAPPLDEQARMIEALLFAAAAPMTLGDMNRRLPEGCDPRAALDRLRGRYAGRGVRLERSGDAWAFRTAPDLGWLMTHEAVETRPLSRAATETLAIIAYHEPVTRAEIEEIRGVAVSKGTIDLLMERGWIALGVRRMTPGRPVTFVVTDGFLDHFGLAATRDLPGVKELREAGLLSSQRPAPDEDEGLGSGGQDDMFA
jgi:segregation and condensation protein B